MLADIHGNLEALEAVLDDARGLAIDQWWALGDLVLCNAGSTAKGGLLDHGGNGLTVFQDKQTQVMFIQYSRDIPAECQLVRLLHIEYLTGNIGVLDLKAGESFHCLIGKGQINSNDHAEGHDKPGQNMPTFDLFCHLTLPLKLLARLARSPLSRSLTHMRRSVVCCVAAGSCGPAEM